ncbi:MULTISPECIES: alpha/beta fold hydrolase [Gordonia]|uniref:Putative epoxide hydrolase n=1 Tax=Gordonia malaquae NBRC 108250 TaxID=1223542 RepID=M3TEM4_GORML|nr:alpha/beta hydrolase [Gordonia malaquae]GAC79861.1 putative epoxide hydrolase [Gordonia malaquae NBRC 108250]SEC48577.1 Pimeloyl-ACP methyl ester carboxylesterase [Gordonia malaquae]
METEHLKVEHDGLTFDVKLSGPARGPWVVLLHGFPVDSRCWDDVVPRLHEAGLRTVTFDQRGYSPGARPEHVEDYRLEKLVGDVLGVLGHLNIAYSMIVGHDWGGIVAWHLAAKHPERFTGLVAVSTGHPSAMKEALEAGSDQRERSSYISTFVKPKAEQLLTEDNGVRLTRHGVTPEEVAPLLEPGALTGPLNWYRANFTGDIAATLACPPVEIPTTMVWSDGDTALGREQAEFSGRHVYGDYRFSVIEGIDHWVPQKAAKAVASEISLRSALY